MREVLRGSDLKCRYGGEEFLVLLPRRRSKARSGFADTLRRELSELPIAWKDESLAVTATRRLGGDAREIDAQAIIGRADAALYRAKDQGRNCVRLSLSPRCLVEPVGIRDWGFGIRRDSLIRELR